MSKNQKLWQKAKALIPGGNMLLSKRPDQFLPDFWPTYFSKAKGCQVWDLENTQYTDFSIMGIGTNTLGYGHEEVDLAVKEAVNLGNMSSLNCPEEVYLAERLCEIHPWANMAKFARSGGEANAVAIRIARAFCGKDNVAICGYHGWHDWYLAANLSNKSALESLLLPGLEPNGVPKSLKDTVYTFNYGDKEKIEQIVKNNDIGVIKMEVSRTTEPDVDFLRYIRKLADDNRLVLIFDECTSGFREAFGGLHLNIGVEPDMLMLGKALGNGYAITAVLGREEIMSQAQSSFISSTFWTERIGSVAALKTLEVMQREESWKIISESGANVKNRWTQLAAKFGLTIETSGINALPIFNFQSKFSLEYKTYITQEMLKKNILASNTVYMSIAHTTDIMELYFHHLEPIFKRISEFEDKKNVNDYLETKVCSSGFKRLN
jgi:glutamate-1-semialdehyde 2,1-aminomutase